MADKRRLKMRDLRMVWVRERAESPKINTDEDVYVWKEGARPINVMIQPGNAQIYHGSREMYEWEHGQTIENSLNLFYNGPQLIKAGDGLCVNVLPEDSCDYSIVSVENWPGYQKAYILNIPENRRG
jgi:hypothetical protein